MGSEPVTIDALTTTPAPRTGAARDGERLPDGRYADDQHALRHDEGRRDLPVHRPAADASRSRSSLDNTGSMAHASGGVSKMDALKSAATTFVNRVFDDPRIGAYAKISLVPFAAAVAVDPATARRRPGSTRTGAPPTTGASFRAGMRRSRPTRLMASATGSLCSTI